MSWGHEPHMCAWLDSAASNAGPAMRDLRQDSMRKQDLPAPLNIYMRGCHQPFFYMLRALFLTILLKVLELV